MSRAPRREPARAAPPDTYLYGIVRWPLLSRIGKSLGVGVGDPPAEVRPLRHRSVAALVSDVPADQPFDHTDVRRMRRDLRAHSAVLNRIASQATVLPVRYGTVLPGDEALVAHVLDPQYGWLDEQLRKLDGTVELTLKATYLEQPVLAEVVREQPPQLARPAHTYHARIEKGRSLVSAIQERQAHDRQRLLESIGAHVKEVRLREPTSELMLLSASLLLDRSDLDKFDKALERAAAREANRLHIDCVGPLPPFSFAELRV